MHPRDIAEEGDRDEAIDGTGQQVLLTAVLEHQGVGLVGVEENLIGRDEQDPCDHALEPRIRTNQLHRK